MKNTGKIASLFQVDGKWQMNEVHQINEQSSKLQGGRSITLLKATVTLLVINDY